MRNEAAVDVETNGKTSVGFSDMLVDCGVLSKPAKQRLFHRDEEDKATVDASSSTGLLVDLEEQELRETVAMGSEGVAFGSKLNPNDKEFVPGALKFDEDLVRRAKEDWDLQQRIKPKPEQLTLGWIEGKS